MEPRLIIELDAVRVLVLSILVLWLGSAITNRVELLRRFSIPIAVTGGLLCSTVVALLTVFAEVNVEFDLELRGTLLLIFFSTIGLTAKFSMLKEGGRKLAILAGLTIVMLTLQNALGISIATALGAHWGYGLIGGSVSLAGGHGTAITWGEIAAAGGLGNASSLGLAFATMGLICGGFIGGPIANYLIRRDSLAPAEAEPAASDATRSQPADDGEDRFTVTSDSVIRTLLALAICIGVGDTLNGWLTARSVVLPGFLTAMAVGIAITNFADARSKPLDGQSLNLFNNISLQLFLSMSLMSMQLAELAAAAGPVLLTLVAQVALTTFFAIFVVYRFCGRNYDAAVISAGYSGLCLGATPVGIANMNAVTSRFGACPNAYVIVPLIGAFLLDIINAFVVQGYIEILK